MKPEKVKVTLIFNRSERCENCPFGIYNWTSNHHDCRLYYAFNIEELNTYNNGYCPIANSKEDKVYEL